MNVNYEKLMKCFECVQQKITFKPEIALILGSGLGDPVYKRIVEAYQTQDTIDIYNNEFKGFFVPAWTLG